MTKKSRFIQSDAGAITIEWVAIAGLAFFAAITIAGTMLTGTNQLGTAVANQMSAAANTVNGN
jgi:Flp pilus assembly pilin Flp